MTDPGALDNPTELATRVQVAAVTEAVDGGLVVSVVVPDPASGRVAAYSTSKTGHNHKSPEASQMIAPFVVAILKTQRTSPPKFIAHGAQQISLFAVSTPLSFGNLASCLSVNSWPITTRGHHVGLLHRGNCCGSCS